jgi:hypothetical protein
MRQLAIGVSLVVVATAGAATDEWEARAPLPLPRTEVSAAAVGGEIVVLGGSRPTGAARGAWTRTRLRATPGDGFRTCRSA